MGAISPGPQSPEAELCLLEGIRSHHSIQLARRGHHGRMRGEPVNHAKHGAATRGRLRGWKCLKGASLKAISGAEGTRNLGQKG